VSCAQCSLEARDTTSLTDSHSTRKPMSDTPETKNEKPDPHGFFMALQRLKKLGLPIGTVIDVGASDGRWCRRFLRNFPAAQALLIEGNPIHYDAIRSYEREDPRVTAVCAAAGSRPGKVQFFISPEDCFGGRAAGSSHRDGPVADEMTTVTATTIDRELASRSLPAPYVIKLDTHGLEKEILSGAENHLASASALILELYNLDIGNDCALFWEMCTWLHQRGFRCWDIFDLLRRESDGILWQFDAIFLRSDQPGFLNTKS